MTEAFTIAAEPGLDPDEFVAVLNASGLGARRPVRDLNRMQRMIEHAGLMLVARDGDGTAVGVARSITDFSFCCYLSDLAVDKAWQGRGVGRALIERTRDTAGPECTLILLSAPGAMTYYTQVGPSIGLEKPDTAFIVPRTR